MHHLSLLLPVLLLLTLPANREQLRGNSLWGPAAYELLTDVDSLADFSAVSAAGAPADWHYFSEHRGDSTYITELQSTDRWLLYTEKGDTLRHIHTESSREQSTFNIHAFAEGLQDFAATGRRDMAFLFADSGMVSISVSHPVVLILAPGDTITDATLRRETRRFARRRLDRSGITGSVEETELRWTLSGRLAPLAAGSRRSVHTAGHDTVTTAYVTVFPREWNLGLNCDSPQNAPKNRPAPAHSSFPAELSAEYNPDNRTLTVTATGESQLTVCDVSGRVHLSRSLEEGGGTVSLSALTPDDYVVSVTDGQNRISQTIKIQP